MTEFDRSSYRPRLSSLGPPPGYLDSPFDPGRPVSLPRFSGRNEEIRHIAQSLRGVLAGGPKGLFLSGERAIGKTSLARYIRVSARKEYGIIGSQSSLQTASSIDDVCSGVFSNLLIDVPEPGILNRVMDAMKKHIHSIGIAGFKVEFEPTPREREDLRENLVGAFADVYKALNRDEQRVPGLLLILDDCERLARKEVFANFLRKFMEELSVKDYAPPMFVMLVGFPDTMGSIAKHNPSVPRMFDVIDLKTLTSEETQSFFEGSFQSVNVRIRPDALRTLVRYSGGHPAIAQELGDATFWADAWDSRDHVVDIRDAQDGLYQATEQVGRKFLRFPVLQSFRMETRLPVLKVLAEVPPGGRVSKANLLKVPGVKKDQVEKWRDHMRELGVITVEAEHPGEEYYSFTTQLYRLFMRMEVVRYQRGQRQLYDFSQPEDLN